MACVSTVRDGRIARQEFFLTREDALAVLERDEQAPGRG